MIIYRCLQALLLVSIFGVVKVFPKFLVDYGTAPNFSPEIIWNNLQHVQALTSFEIDKFERTKKTMHGILTFLVSVFRIMIMVSFEVLRLTIFGFIFSIMKIMPSIFVEQETMSPFKQENFHPVCSGIISILRYKSYHSEDFWVIMRLIFHIVMMTSFIFQSGFEMVYK